MRLGAFNPRQRYLTGLGILSPRQMRHQLRLARMGAFNPRARYLTGPRMGQDDSDFDYTESNDVSPIVPTFTPLANPAPAIPDVITAPFALPSPSSYLGPTSGTLLNTIGQAVATIGKAGVVQPLTAAPSSASWFSGTTAGIANSTLLLGVGAIALLALLASGGGRRGR
jgi:hypothetical protein